MTKPKKTTIDEQAIVIFKKDLEFLKDKKYDFTLHLSCGSKISVKEIIAIESATVQIIESGGNVAQRFMGHIRLDRIEAIIHREVS